MRKFKSPKRGYCASCEGFITARPVYRMDEAYCCVGCAAGGPCVCNYEADLADDGVNGLGLLAPVETTTEPVAVPDAETAEPAIYAWSER